MIQNLMIGDWVRHANGTPMQVTAIKGEHFACGCPHCWSYNNEYFPIVLTPNIIEQFGIKSESRWNERAQMYEHKFTLNPALYLVEDLDEFNRREKDKYVICNYVSVEDFGECRYDFVELKYVHELQRALTLIQHNSAIAVPQKLYL